jgi:hypothetical protein
LRYRSRASFRRDFGRPRSKDELDAKHLGASPNDFANPTLTTFEKSQFKAIRDG